jgi:imidazole glycerol-phosphate synthase subunit HisH
VRIVVCDVGLGNLRSVERALREAGRGQPVDVEVTGDPGRVAAADRLVLPGQGGFGDCARALDSVLGDVVRDHVRRTKPYLGICLGFQALFASSEEAAGCSGLGVLEGQVVRLREGVDPATGGKLKIPHAGWNEVVPEAAHPGLLSVGTQYFAFMHSFVAVPRDPGVVAGTTEYGGERFVSAVARGNLFACQFHPEKSQRAGLALLERFLAS